MYILFLPRVGLYVRFLPLAGARGKTSCYLYIKQTQQKFNYVQCTFTVQQM
jgi:hypothetical protein